MEFLDAGSSRLRRRRTADTDMEFLDAAMTESLMAFHKRPKID
jgi:hypothetical protein